MACFSLHLILLVVKHDITRICTRNEGCITSVIQTDPPQIIDLKCNKLVLSRHHEHYLISAPKRTYSLRRYTFS